MCAGPVHNAATACADAVTLGHDMAVVCPCRANSSEVVLLVVGGDATLRALLEPCLAAVDEQGNNLKSIWSAAMLWCAAYTAGSPFVYNAPGKMHSHPTR